MKLKDFKDSLYVYIVERTIPQWRADRVSGITSKRMLPRGVATLPRQSTFDNATGRLEIRVKSAKDYGKWLDWEEKEGKDYNPQTVGPFAGSKLSFPGYYTCLIHWNDWYQIRRDLLKGVRPRTRWYFPEMTQGEIIDAMLENLDIKLHCNCPSFYWQGMAYKLGNDNAIYPAHIPSRVWLKRHTQAGGPEYPICKHLKAVMLDLYYPNSYLRDKIKRDAMEMLPAVVPEPTVPEKPAEYPPPYPPRAREPFEKGYEKREKDIRAWKERMKGKPRKKWPRREPRYPWEPPEGVNY